MLDKSIPYHVVAMLLPKEQPLPDIPALPNGYAYRFFQPGDEAAWCDIETSVTEFDNPAQAREYFDREFTPYPAQLARNMVFITNPDGVPVANACAWLKADDANEQIQMLHWVAVRPEEQGKGLGRAVVCKTLSLFAGERKDIWLTTQTWSHVAIELYVSVGFHPHKTAVINRHKNDFEAAARVLEGAMRPKGYARFMYTAL